MTKVHELFLKVCISFMTCQAAPVGNEGIEAWLINDFAVQLVHNTTNKTLCVDKRLSSDVARVIILCQDLVASFI